MLVPTKKRNRKVGSLKNELVTKSAEAALAAIKVFNDPLIKFKSETYIVLMIIAWTYLLHAYYRSKRIEYRYFEQRAKRKVFDHTKNGAYKYWELERCLNEKSCPLDRDTKNNLRFLIQLRHEIEHQMTLALDSYLSGRYQACAINYNHYLKSLFNQKRGIDEHLTYSIQFIQLTEEQIGGPKPAASIPPRLQAFISEFDTQLSDDEFASQKYSCRLLFKNRLAKRENQADRVVEFIKQDSPLAEHIDKQYWVLRDTEKQKYRASDIVAEVQKAGFLKFKIQPEHVRMWQQENAKDPTKSYGVNIRGVWYWYESWKNRCIELCQAAGDKFQ